ncbi:hypothetical protein POKO110462_11330 [Pontibacter korlensis]|nr:hypothetical protein [Pontibacter korlensis]
MKRTEKAPLLYFVGTILLISTAAYFFIYKYFDEEDFEFDTYDEHTEDYF